MDRKDVYKAFDSERNYQDQQSANSERPDMIEDFTITHGLQAIDVNLQKAKGVWYADSDPYSQIMNYLRKIGAICVKMGERYDMPFRLPKGLTTGDLMTDLDTVFRKPEVPENCYKPLKFEDVRVAPGIEVHNISAEALRVYTYLEGTTEIDVAIENPVAVHFRESGGQTIVCENGGVYYMKPGWQTVSWLPKEGANHIDF